jgi:hypothetical protein
MFHSLLLLDLITGLLTCSNPCGSVLFSHFTGTALGNSGAPPSWWNWVGNCTACAQRVKPLEGIFCANFASSRGDWPPCRMVWHEQCSECLGNDKFPMAILTDDDNNVSPKQQARTKRLNVGRSGVHCVMAFQCETCWIRNLTECDMALPCDDALRMCIRRANLDAFAGRSKSTI